MIRLFFRGTECPKYIQDIRPPLAKAFFGSLVTLAIHRKDGWHLYPLIHGKRGCVIDIKGDPKVDTKVTVYGGPTIVHTALL